MTSWLLMAAVWGRAAQASRRGSSTWNNWSKFTGNTGGTKAAEKEKGESRQSNRFHTSGSGIPMELKRDKWILGNQKQQEAKIMKELQQIWHEATTYIVTNGVFDWMWKTNEPPWNVMARTEQEQKLQWLLMNWTDTIDGNECYDW